MSLVGHVRMTMRFNALSYDPRPIPAAPAKPDPLFDAFRWQAIITETAKRHGLTVAEIVGQARSRWIAWPRFECCHRLRTELGWSLPQIGRRLGDRDHSTILSALSRYESPLVQEWLQNNASLISMRVSTP